jgi:hypothetical protein
MVLESTYKRQEYREETETETYCLIAFKVIPEPYGIEKQL